MTGNTRNPRQSPAGVQCDDAKRLLIGIPVTLEPRPEWIEADRAKRAALDRARVLWELGAEIIRLAVRNGAVLPEGAGFIPDTWPCSEAAERRHWRRPFVEDVRDAA